MPKYYFRVKNHNGKGYLYKVRCVRIQNKNYPLQKSLFIGQVDKISYILFHCYHLLYLSFDGIVFVSFWFE